MYVAHNNHPPITPPLDLACQRNFVLLQSDCAQHHKQSPSFKFRQNVSYLHIG